MKICSDTICKSCNFKKQCNYIDKVNFCINCEDWYICAIPKQVCRNDYQIESCNNCFEQVGDKGYIQCYSEDSTTYIKNKWEVNYEYKGIFDKEWSISKC